MNIVEEIRSETKSFNNKIAVCEGDNYISYYELFEIVDNTSSQLKDNGIGKNDIVAFQHRNSIEYIAVSLAILSTGAVFTPISTSMPQSEYDELVEKLSVQFFVGVESTMESSPRSIQLNIKKYSSKDSTLTSKISDFNPAFIRFSSGTTGENKGVLISHESVIQRTNAANKCLSVTSEDEIIWLLDMSFHFVVTIMLFLRKGAKIVLAGNSIPFSLYNALNKNNATMIYASPLHYKLLLDSQSFTPPILNYIRLAISTAIKLPVSLAESFYEKFNIKISEAYGIIEVGLPFIHYPVSMDKIGSVGKKLPEYEVKIKNLDSKGRGEISLKGPGLFSAYLNPFLTFDDSRDDWFNTGDIGYFDNDNYLFIYGRNKDIINFSGIKIFPYKVEEVLKEHPSVSEVTVYPETHSYFGEIPCASIVLEKDYDKEKILQDIKEFCYTKLSKMEVPQKMNFVENIEKTLSGKIKRNF